MFTLTNEPPPEWPLPLLELNALPEEPLKPLMAPVDALVIDPSKFCFKDPKSNPDRFVLDWSSDTSSNWISARLNGALYSTVSIGTEYVSSGKIESTINNCNKKMRDTKITYYYI